MRYGAVGDVDLHRKVISVYNPDVEIVTLEIIYYRRQGGGSDSILEGCQ